MRRIKKTIFSILTVVVILLVVFLVFEVFSRIIVGKRLIVKVEEDGLYHFKPNQQGWYHHKLRTPPARINNVGARGSDVDVLSKKYIFLGDSFTFGWELKDNETMSYYFMDKNGLSGQVINYGNGGFGLEHMISTYNFYKDLFGKNNVVIAILIEDDFYRPLEPYQESRIKELFWKVREKSSSISWIWANFRVVQNLIKNVEREKESKDIFEEDGKKLLDFKNLVKNDEGTLVYVFYEYNQTEYSNKARMFCEKNDLLCITDVYESMKGENIYGFDGTHPSNDTNLRVAERITNFINKNVG